MASLHSLLQRRLIFLGGKGGVGKTVLSAAIASELARQGHRTLWVTIEDHDYPLGETRVAPPGFPASLTHLNVEANRAFEEYIGLKLGVAGLAKVFVGNKLVRYMSQAAPGLHDLVLLGKIWYEREHFDRVVVDLPSTGYGISMFQSPANFARLFQGGPIQRDAQAMLATLGDPRETAHIVVALPEEMPLQEAQELSAKLREFFPHNPSELIVNRVMSRMMQPEAFESPAAASPTQDALFTTTLENYLHSRLATEAAHLGQLHAQKITFTAMPYLEPVRDGSASERIRMIQSAGQALTERLRGAS